ncbi:hypothetical protein A3D84_05385 [Candidatus Woesebacteria bacterium RIFCSPHIGHO2_02_FULL_42_20]|uniref:Nucleotidyl transferase AbiEii/AbiGii toxin family protein n=1 Tax=Candidatus Woesebacteria bacterium RIFCSPHIGHO2_12_FULL_41_24 TaxID=1802510 RepID=A0A1F8AQ67_9BACT|nr:MAG: hypothetical protein A2W15_04625 [Candidatus Woesebacteria bacterium RBG_16_41_13]OGM34622.1 MAG: hypothetical protein A3D84_05385 [Candidatus Woesebacteria bacterium RIFCSPHIGHO2_02_FULL_42_20]OGM53780.1 MAG: hypothetical protein A3E44_05170 [Candidatus Woesebacteria bacterium RIFCSPHIGHO2_12_FULL_41_24]OGM71188.1 MAG: hypothetical protein A3I55_05195 [Candidatus Woesebacteria bacterium RIFCSPLOWO2_02_FULL_42_10]
MNKNRFKVFNKLRAFKNMGVLGGGTALALQVGHRVSFDFDIFSYHALPGHLWKDAKKVLGQDCEKLLDFEDQLNLITPGGVEVTFFHDEYQPLFKAIKTNFIDLMDLRDIACNKAYIIGRRPKWRDYVDIYFLLKDKKISLDQLLKLSIRKFKNDFSKRLFLQQLVYYSDITDYKIEFLKDEISPDKIKVFLEGEVSRYKTREL